jgi:hypothetical protein
MQPDSHCQAPAHHWLAGDSSYQKASEARPTRGSRAGMQTKLGAGQKHAKQVLIGLGCKTCLMARRGCGHEHRGVCGHHTQPMPKRHPTSGMSQAQQVSD